jgi:hypothetical protein
LTACTYDPWQYQKHWATMSRTSCWASTDGSQNQILLVAYEHTCYNFLLRCCPVRFVPFCLTGVPSRSHSWTKMIQKVPSVLSPQLRSGTVRNTMGQISRSALPRARSSGLLHRHQASGARSRPRVVASLVSHRIGKRFRFAQGIQRPLDHEIYDV